MSSEMVDMLLIAAEECVKVCDSGDKDKMRHVLEKLDQQEQEWRIRSTVTYGKVALDFLNRMDKLDQKRKDRSHSDLSCQPSTSPVPAP